uniref:Uncharacterized protein n=1 Tax=Anopheles atroparvus TaxID=41427 RepID=A0A182JB62_ANOAO
MSVSKTITETVTNSKTTGAPQPPASAASGVPLLRSYGKIVLTLENCLLPEAKLDQTPSQNDGLDRETETDLRILGCELIQTAGILLKLPQGAVAKMLLLLLLLLLIRATVGVPVLLWCRRGLTSVNRTAASVEHHAALLMLMVMGGRLAFSWARCTATKGRSVECVRVVVVSV